MASDDPTIEDARCGAATAAGGDRLIPRPCASLDAGVLRPAVLRPRLFGGVTAGWRRCRPGSDAASLPNRLDPSIVRQLIVTRLRPPRHVRGDSIVYAWGWSVTSSRDACAAPLAAGADYGLGAAGRARGDELGGLSTASGAGESVASRTRSLIRLEVPLFASPEDGAR